MHWCLISWSFFLIDILFTTDTCFLRLNFISLMEQADSARLLTTPLDVLRDLYGYCLIFLLWRVVIFNNSLAYFFFVTSTIRLVLSPICVGKLPREGTCSPWDRDLLPVYLHWKWDPKPLPIPGSQYPLLGVLQFNRGWSSTVWTWLTFSHCFLAAIR